MKIPRMDNCKINDCQLVSAGWGQRTANTLRKGEIVPLLN
jgi:hypothetical protein